MPCRPSGLPQRSQGGHHRAVSPRQGLWVAHVRRQQPTLWELLEACPACRESVQASAVRARAAGAERPSPVDLGTTTSPCCASCCPWESRPWPSACSHCSTVWPLLLPGGAGRGAQSLVPDAPLRLLGAGLWSSSPVERSSAAHPPAAPRRSEPMKAVRVGGCRKGLC